jgi:hypothetical protein
MPPPKVEQKGPSLPAFIVARHFLTVNKTDSLRLYGPIGEEGAPNGPPQLKLEPPKDQLWQPPALFPQRVVGSKKNCCWPPKSR